MTLITDKKAGSNGHAEPGVTDYWINLLPLLGFDPYDSPMVLFKYADDLLLEVRKTLLGKGLSRGQ
jgi:hypothetical protein